MRKEVKRSPVTLANKCKLIAELAQNDTLRVQSWIKMILNLNVKCKVSGTNYLNHIQFEIKCNYDSFTTIRRSKFPTRKWEFKFLINETIGDSMRNHEAYGLGIERHCACNIKWLDGINNSLQLKAEAITNGISWECIGKQQSSGQ